MKAAYIQRVTALHKANKNTGERASGRGMCARETLEPLVYCPGMFFLLSTIEEHARTENCPQAS